MKRTGYIIPHYPFFSGSEKMGRVHGRGPIEVYDPGTTVKPRVYDNDRRYALLVVDMLNDFVYGKIKAERAGSAHDAGIPVLYPNDSHTKKDFELYRWGEHAMRGTKGAAVIKELRPRKRDVQIPKTTYSSFFSTRLEKELKRTYDGKGANTLIMAGLHTDCCVLHTTAPAFFLGYETMISADAAKAFTAF